MLLIVPPKIRKALFGEATFYHCIPAEEGGGIDITEFRACQLGFRGRFFFFFFAPGSNPVTNGCVKP